MGIRAIFGSIEFVVHWMENFFTNLQECNSKHVLWEGNDLIVCFAFVI